ncbi:MAG: class I SAM-dependent methyltransferase [Saprospiraceae bacterium]|nr:class I SAM-dependent methyltransferase [Saprospiraceae bacterium]
MKLIDRIHIYLDYWIRSKTIYQLHSPRLFQLVQKSFDHDQYYYAFDLIWQMRYQIVSRGELIPEDEFSISRSQAGQILGRFAHRSVMPLEHLHSLFRVCRFLNPQSILELGTCLGISSLALGLAAPNARVTGIEGNPFFCKEAETLLANLRMTHVKIENKNFDQFLDEYTGPSFDLVFLDGDHQSEATKRYLTKLLPFLTKKTCIILDDIHWSADMSRCWKEICKWPQFHCSLETLRWGLLFTDPGLSSGNYVFCKPSMKPWQKYF